MACPDAGARLGTRGRRVRGLACERSRPRAGLCGDGSDLGGRADAALGPRHVIAAGGPVPRASAGIGLRGTGRHLCRRSVALAGRGLARLCCGDQSRCRGARRAAWRWDCGMARCRCRNRRVARRADPPDSRSQGPGTDQSRTRSEAGRDCRRPVQHRSASRPARRDCRWRARRSGDAGGCDQRLLAARARLHVDPGTGGFDRLGRSSRGRSG